MIGLPSWKSYAEKLSEITIVEILGLVRKNEQRLLLHKTDRKCFGMISPTLVRKCKRKQNGKKNGWALERRKKEKESRGM